MLLVHIPVCVLKVKCRGAGVGMTHYCQGKFYLDEKVIRTSVFNYNPLAFIHEWNWGHQNIRSGTTLSRLVQKGVQ